MLHVVIGAPCSGKSTYCEEHASAGDVVIDFDKLAIALGSTDSHSAPDAIRAAAFAARAAAVDEVISKQLDAWIIHTEPKPEQLKRYEEAGAEFIRMDATLSECLERCERDGRPEGTRERIIEFYSSDEKGFQMNQKDFNGAAFKAEGEHTVTGYASTWDREPDSYGDIVRKGAFLNAIEKLNESGKKLPLLFGHRTDDPLLNIGVVDSLEEDERGLKFTATIDMENERGAYAYKLLKEGRLEKVSFAYSVLDAATVTLEDGTKANELRELDIFEISLVPIPANHHAEIVEVKAGRVISRKNMNQLEAAYEMANNLIDIIGNLIAENSEDIETEEQEANSEEPAKANEQEQKSAEVLAAMTAMIERL